MGFRPNEPLFDAANNSYVLIIAGCLFLQIVVSIVATILNSDYFRLVVGLIAVYGIQAATILLNEVRDQYRELRDDAGFIGSFDFNGVVWI